MTLADEVEALCPCRASCEEPYPEACEKWCRCLVGYDHENAVPCEAKKYHDLAWRVREMEKELKFEWSKGLSHD